MPAILDTTLGALFIGVFVSAVCALFAAFASDAR
jgi:hypothetical protein